jgi:hypothetical protein
MCIPIPIPSIVNSSCSSRAEYHVSSSCTIVCFRSVLKVLTERSTSVLLAIRHCALYDSSANSRLASLAPSSPQLLYLQFIASHPLSQPVRHFGMFHTESATMRINPSRNHSVSVSYTSMMRIERHKVPDVSNKTSMLQLADTAYDGDVSARRSNIHKDHAAELLETPCLHKVSARLSELTC